MDNENTKAGGEGSGPVIDKWHKNRRKHHSLHKTPKTSRGSMTGMGWPMVQPDADGDFDNDTGSGSGTDTDNDTTTTT